MTQEDKQLLLKDISARLSYGVILNCCNSIGEKLTSIDKNGLINHDYDIEEVKPYLRPMSSMTEEERVERMGLLWKLEGHIDEDVTYKYQDWLNKHHFDYRGLIPMGLVIAVTKENNPYG